MLFEKRIHGVATLMALCSLTLGLLWFCAAYWIVFNGFGGLELRTPAAIDTYAMAVVLISISFTVDHLRTRTSRTYELHGANKWSFSVFAAFQQVITLLLVLALYMLASKDRGVSRLFLMWFVAGLFPVLTLAHRLVPQWLSKTLFGGRYLNQAIVVSNGFLGQERIRSWLGRHQRYGVHIQDTLNIQDFAGASLNSNSILDRLADELKRRRPAMVIMHQFPLDSKALLRLKHLCDRVGSRMIVALDMDPEFADKVSFHKDGDMQLISIRQEPLECPTNRILKRLLDIAVALPVVTFLLPVLTLWVWMVQRRQSPGPIFHRQLRSGMQNEHFRLYKFRSMHVGHGSENKQATRDDDRIFPFGRWMRKASVDEIPQFINVLIGDMSVVGPRPHLPKHDEEFAQIVDHYNLRHLIKPGITGLAQVKGFRGEVTNSAQITERVQSDVFYIEHWSLSMDFSIISRTALQVFRTPDTAY
jgi:exopolysaccharide biosynthesis polyprenyl glycosylphosphotransferase